MGPSCQHKQYGKGIAQQLCKYAVGAGRRCVWGCVQGEEQSVKEVGEESSLEENLSGKQKQIPP